MKPSFYILLFAMAIIKGAFLKDDEQITQSPSNVLTDPHTLVHLYLRHNLPKQDTVLWYQRLKGDTVLKLIGYLYFTYPTVQDQFKDNFNITGNACTFSNLHIYNSKVTDSAEYFGAARLPQHQH
ncbi:hypothetical protein NQD34_016081 [Periophthalmus magnuspinnatus]|nr:hypothetical protein NQD34_016081 [Periophthalmus magnuspinnatus]